MSVTCALSPVTFPAGRARLRRYPAPQDRQFRHDHGNRCRGLLAARAAGVPLVTMRSTLSRTNSAARSGYRSSRPSDDRYSMTKVFPSRYPSSCIPWRSHRRWPRSPPSMSARACRCDRASPVAAHRQPAERLSKREGEQGRLISRVSGLLCSLTRVPVAVRYGLVRHQCAERQRECGRQAPSARSWGSSKPLRGRFHLSPE